jgi:hypothetical protein
MRDSSLASLVGCGRVDIVNVERSRRLNLLVLACEIINLPGKLVSLDISTGVIISVIHLFQAELYLITVNWLFVFCL